MAGGETPRASPAAVFAVAGADIRTSGPSPWSTPKVQDAAPTAAISSQRNKGHATADMRPVTSRRRACDPPERAGARRVVMGGMASAAREPRQSRMFLDGPGAVAGAVGVT